MDGIEYPVCSGCGKSPALFRIRAKILTEDLQVKYIDIRHQKGGKRLTKTYDCMAVLDRVNEEMEKGTFNYRDYDSEDGRAEFLFENVVAKYLAHHKKRLERNELSPSGYANKRTSCNALLESFTGRDICTIKADAIEEFKDSYVDKFRARDLALAELKSILIRAEEKGMISKVPKFGLIKSSNKRKEIISLDTAIKVIAAVEDPQYQFMMKLLLSYPVRPGELRALQWRDVDYFGNTVTFQRHFSKDIVIEGRKSIKDGEKSEIQFPLSTEFREFLATLPRPLKKDAYIFPGKEREFVTGKCLSNAWRKATKKLKLPDYDMYELRHARLTQISEQSNGNIPLLLKASGHTNVQTLMGHYVRDKSDLSEFFNWFRSPVVDINFVTSVVDS